MTKEERTLTIALGNEIARNRKLTNMLNRVGRNVYEQGRCASGMPEYEDLINSFAEAIDRDYVWKDLENDIFEQK